MRLLCAVGHRFCLVNCLSAILNLKIKSNNSNNNNNKKSDRTITITQ